MTWSVIIKNGKYYINLILLSDKLLYDDDSIYVRLNYLCYFSLNMYILYLNCVNLSNGYLLPALFIELFYCIIVIG